MCSSFLLGSTYNFCLRNSFWCHYYVLFFLPILTIPALQLSDQTRKPFPNPTFLRCFCFFSVGEKFFFIQNSDYLIWLLLCRGNYDGGDRRGSKATARGNCKNRERDLQAAVWKRKSRWCDHYLKWAVLVEEAPKAAYSLPVFYKL